MISLVIDTCNSNLTVALVKDSNILGIFSEQVKIDLSTKIFPVMQDIFVKANIKPNDIDNIFVANGPGSFTGIRIGVSTVKGFADPTHKKVLSVTSFDTIAYNKTSGKVLAIINARHDNFYVSGYENGKVAFEPIFTNLEKVQELSKEYKLLSYEAIDGLNTEIVSPLEGLKNAINAKIELASEDVNSVKPFYLRLSQAEEGRL